MRYTRICRASTDGIRVSARPDSPPTSATGPADVIRSRRKSSTRPASQSKQFLEGALSITRLPHPYTNLCTHARTNAPRHMQVSSHARFHTDMTAPQELGGRSALRSSLPPTDGGEIGGHTSSLSNRRLFLFKVLTCSARRAWITECV